jgi:hypothetical protein
MSAAFCIIYSNKKGKKDDVATMGHGGKITQTKKGHLVKKRRRRRRLIAKHLNGTAMQQQKQQRRGRDF